MDIIFNDNIIAEIYKSNNNSKPVKQTYDFKLDSDREIEFDNILKKYLKEIKENYALSKR